MLKQRQTTDRKMLLSLSPKELEKHLEITLALQHNLSYLVKVHGIAKEEIMSSCGLSMDQYYRRMNNVKMWEVDNLLEIVRMMVDNDE